MKIDDLYPYWGDVHDRIVETIEYLPPQMLDVRPDGSETRSIRQIIIHMIDMERFWIAHLAAQGAWDRPQSADFNTRELLAEGLTVTRAATMRYIETLQPVTLRAVRTIPVDAEMNTPETNRAISWLIWQAVQHDSYHYGQIMLRKQALG
jgi:uncharacterized damage-inducible protein DinB